MKSHLFKSPLAENLALGQSFGHFLLQYGPINATALDYLVKNSFYVRIKKNEILIQPGTLKPAYFFILKGVLRGYIANEGREITTWIDWENSMVSTIANMETNIITDEAIQAIEESELIEFSHDTLNYIYDKFPETNRIGRLILTENLRTAEERAYIARLPNAEERYRRFLLRSGELINRISLKYIASFLNMKLETLSRIRGRY